MSEDVINKVLMGSPRLEFLTLETCFRFSRLDILSESLRKLVIDTCISICDKPLELEIVAPKIESLEILGNFKGSIYDFSETSAFSIVKLQISNDEDNHGKMGSSWHCKPASKFPLCGDIGYRHNIQTPALHTASVSNKKL
nr:hypothetical protein CFP56_67408 [Quercus suber]